MVVRAPADSEPAAQAQNSPAAEQMTGQVRAQQAAPVQTAAAAQTENAPAALMTEAQTAAAQTSQEAPAPAVQATPAEENLQAASGLTGSTILLFKTPTCPNCKAAGALLDRAGVDYEPLNANEEKELVGRYGVKQAPTLVLIDNDGFVKFKGVSEIKGWLMNR